MVKTAPHKEDEGEVAFRINLVRRVLVALSFFVALPLQYSSRTKRDQKGVDWDHFPTEMDSD